MTRLPIAGLVAALLLASLPGAVAAQSCYGGYCGGGDIEGDARVEVNVSITVDPAGAGIVLVNSEAPKGAVYSTLQGETLKLEAIASDGYVFDRWGEWFDESSSIVEAPIYNHKTLTAHFVRETPGAADDSTVDGPTDVAAPSSIPSGTVALDRRGNTIADISVELRQPRALPSSGVLLGDVHDYKPDGATFDPPLLIALPYNARALPAGVAEDELVVAAYDSESQDWVPLPSFVNRDMALVQTEVSHFSEFAVVAPLLPGTAPLITPGFSFSSLIISPSTTYPGRDVTVSVTASYVGANAQAKSHIFVTLDGEVADETVVSLSPGDSVLVRFTVRPEQEGAHKVEVSGLVETVTVDGSAPAPVLTQAIALAEQDRFAPVDLRAPSLLSRWRTAAYAGGAIMALLLVVPLLGTLRRRLLRLKYDL